MRVTNAMITGNAISDLARLKENLANAQAAVNGNFLSRPSDDPAKVVEMMDLNSSMVKLQRAQTSSNDAKDWLNAAEDQLSAMVQQMDNVRDMATQASSPAFQDASSRDQMAQAVLAIRNSMQTQINSQYRGQFLFAGGMVKTAPFADDGSGSVTYVANSTTEITREIAPGLTVATNIPGNRLQAEKFMATLTQLADDIQNGRADTISGARMQEITDETSHLVNLQAEVGVRQNQLEQYSQFSSDAILHIQQRMSDVTGGGMEQLVMKLADAQSAYQAALMAISKTMPTSLIDYMR